MQVKIDLVDQHHGSGFDSRGLHGGVGRTQPTREIQHDGQDTPFAVGQVAYGECSGSSVDQEDTVVGSAETQVAVTGQETSHGVIQGAQQRPVTLDVELLIHFHPACEVAQLNRAVGERALVRA